MKDPVARLTDGQRECLRMVYRHMETKEIARVLGISPDGVTQRIKAAMRTLGVNRRRDAALMLAEAERTETYPPQVYPPRDIADSHEPGTFDRPTGVETEVEPLGGVMREEQTIFRISAQGNAFPVPMGGARPDDVGVLKRLAWIAGIAIGVALAFGALVSGVEALTRLVWS